MSEGRPLKDSPSKDRPERIQMGWFAPGLLSPGIQAVIDGRKGMGYKDCPTYDEKRKY